MWWLDVVQLVVTIVGVGYLVKTVEKLNQSVQQLRVQMETYRVRQGQIARGQSMKKSPGVDAKARTVIRDTDDLPLTGRMSTGIHRKRTDGPADDD